MKTYVFFLVSYFFIFAAVEGMVADMFRHRFRWWMVLPSAALLAGLTWMMF